MDITEWSSLRIFRDCERMTGVMCVHLSAMRAGCGKTGSVEHDNLCKKMDSEERREGCDTSAGRSKGCRAPDKDGARKERAGFSLGQR